VPEIALNDLARLRTSIGEIGGRPLAIADASAMRARSLPAFATVALWALRTASDRGFASAAAELSDLFDALREAPDAPRALWTIFSNLSTISEPAQNLVGVVAGQLSEPAREDLRQLSEPAREDVMDLVEQFAQKKKEEGRAEGRAEGRRGLLLKQLTLKFGPPSDAIHARIAEASLEDTDRWAERILTATTLEDVFAGE